MSISDKPPTTPNKPKRADWLRYVILVMLWGSAFALSKVAVAELPPTIVAAARIWIAVGLIFAWMIYRKHKLPMLWPKPDARWLWFVPIGLTGAALPFLLNAWALQSLDPGLVSILLATMPLSVAFLAHFTIANDKMTARKILGLVLGLVGVVLLVGPGFLSGLGGVTVIAQLVVLFSAVLYAINSVLIHFMPETPPSVSSTMMLLVGGLVLLPFAIIDVLHTDMPSLSVLVAVFLLGLGATGIGSILYMQTIRSAGPSFMVTSNYFVSPFAIFTGALFFGEKLGGLAYLALLIIFLGLFLERKK
ncbi:Permease of the drug/metabolite transporter (DMT) superfamily [hydrothermal vent metagenome]|uniref:Permease of the drug/metabolite transporter (DMT) superfamily n=1 Tax=hydrothermal vent metagenome TaxID=652676 RepID=A0A3B0R258_9ZZZZ